MVRYAVRDVQATWECYADLITRFERLKLTRTAPEKVYSEAGIGKAYLKEMGIAPWRDVQPDVPAQLQATILGCYFGGRSEVRIRREVRQVILCDFLSMYPTVCTHMGLWRFAIASGMTWMDSTADDAGLPRRDRSWTRCNRLRPGVRLATLVRVIPDGEIFPVRADYAETRDNRRSALTTSRPRLRSGSRWRIASLPNCSPAKRPESSKAMSFTPGPVQPGLTTDRYRREPRNTGLIRTTTDFFKRTIELRQSVKHSANEGRNSGDERVPARQPNRTPSKSAPTRPAMEFGSRSTWPISPPAALLRSGARWMTRSASPR